MPQEGFFIILGMCCTYDKVTTGLGSALTAAAQTGEACLREGGRPEREVRLGEEAL